jgi:hypothetical protein
MWTADQKEIVYNISTGFYAAVSVSTHPPFTVGNAVRFPQSNTGGGPLSVRPMDISPDGQRILGVTLANESLSGDSSTQQINVVLNWFEELKQRVP